jgi:signal transduction histidine kinase
MIDPDVDLNIVGRLLALIAHDLRNPLSAIHSNLGFLNSTLAEEREEAARGGSSDRGEELRDALSDGLISCEGLTHMIDNIEILGQVLREASLPAKSVLSAADLVQDTVGRCLAVADSYGIKLERARASGDLAHANVVANREQTCKALGNLIRNAIQHSSPGQTVTVGLRWPLEGDRNRLQVVVEDQGAPIATSVLAGLFTANGQVRAKASSDGRYSRALGLYIARLGAELGGGRVSAEAAPNSSNNCLVLTLSAS